MDVGDIDLAELRRLLEAFASDLGDHYTHETLREGCEDLGLPEPPPEGGISKRRRVSASLSASPDSELPIVARRILDRQMAKEDARNAIEDVLWAAENPPRIAKRTRHDIARALNLADFVRRGDRFMRLLDKFWLMNDRPEGSTFSPGAGFNFLTTRRILVNQHVLRNPGDWSTEDLFQELGAFDAPDMRFARFLEGLTSAELILDDATQQRIVNAVDSHLRTAGFEMRETGTEEGYPVFQIVSTRSRISRLPKNIIFASSAKPDLRFRDALDNDIEIVGSADKVLVYDRPIGVEGVRWRDLQQWWRDSRKILDEDEAKSTLYSRLRNSLPANSDQQRLLFDLYHDIFRTTIPDLPALLPEVWWHWDPKTVRERGPEAMLRFRMDFLLLLPGGARIVLEVDGRRHYSINGRADPAAYAANMRADRELKLSGYEVFRFGTAELDDRAKAPDLIREFFFDLFQVFKVPLPVQKQNAHDETAVDP